MQRNVRFLSTTSICAIVDVIKYTKEVIIMTHRHALRGFALFVCFFLFSNMLTGCTRQQNKVSKNGFYFDTIITITLYNTKDDTYIDDCFQMASNYENKFSNTIKDSEISKINAADGAFVTVSDDTVELLKAGIQYGKESEGRFDIAIGTLSDLWNVSEISKTLTSDDNEADKSVLPTDEEIQNALLHTDFRFVEIKGNQVRLTDSETQLDLGGIAKGFIADKMRNYLREQGVTEGVISLGGNVLTLGSKEDGSPYTIGIQKPFAENGTSLGVLKVKDASVVSSGIYERYYRINGRIYHHILDPSTGYPVDNNLYQVTIISSSSMDGDALSTSCFTLGLDKGMQLIEHTKNVEAIFVTDDGTIHTSSGIGDSIQFEKD